jgi:hypothetical protein
LICCAMTVSTSPLLPNSCTGTKPSAKYGLQSEPNYQSQFSMQLHAAFSVCMPVSAACRLAARYVACYWQLHQQLRINDCVTNGMQYKCGRLCECALCNVISRIVACMHNHHGVCAPCAMHNHGNTTTVIHHRLKYTAHVFCITWMM